MFIIVGRLLENGYIGLAEIQGLLMVGGVKGGHPATGLAGRGVKLLPGYSLHQFLGGLANHRLQVIGQAAGEIEQPRFRGGGRLVVDEIAMFPA